MSGNVTSGIFYGVPVETIAEWCSVSVETAKRYKAGKVLPSPQALKLFQLYRDRRVLASPAWDGWLVKGGLLVDPEGNETTQGQLRAYYFIYQLVRELSRDDPDAWAKYEVLVRDAAGF